jgi:hypothetical protein
MHAAGACSWMRNSLKSRFELPSPAVGSDLKTQKESEQKFPRKTAYSDFYENLLHHFSVYIIMK